MLLTAPPREARRQARRRRLVEAAMGLFAERGYHETTVDDVVAAARMSKSAFYEFFESKQDCFKNLLAQEGGILMAAVTSAAAEGEGQRERLRLGIHAFVRACARHRRLARLLLVESVGLSPAIEEVRAGLHGGFADMVEEIARSAGPGDRFYAGVDPVVFGRAVVGAVNEATGHFLAAREADPETLAEGLCRIFGA